MRSSGINTYSTNLVRFHSSSGTKWMQGKMERREVDSGVSFPSVGHCALGRKPSLIARTLRGPARPPFPREEKPEKRGGMRWAVRTTRSGPGHKRVRLAPVETRD